MSTTDDLDAMCPGDLRLLVREMQARQHVVEAALRERLAHRELLSCGHHAGCLKPVRDDTISTVYCVACVAYEKGYSEGHEEQMWMRIRDEKERKR